MSAAAGIPIIGSLISGLQSRSAANNAEKALLGSYTNAGNTQTEAVNRVNPLIQGAADKWGGAVMDAGSAAAQGATDAADKGIAGVNDAIAGVNGAVTAGQGMLQPYSAAGGTALETLSKLLGKPQTYQYQADPGYQFRLAEGQKQITRMAAAHGAAGGGGTAKALAQYNSGLASQEYNTGWQRWNTQNQERQSGLTTLAGMGERAGEFSSDLGVRGAAFGLQGKQFNANLGEAAAQYGGSMRTGTTQWAGTQGINAVDKTSANSLNLADFLSNMQLQTGKTQAGADMTRASIWNNMIGQMTGSAMNMPWDKWFPTNTSGKSKPGYGPAGPPPPGTGGQY